MKLVVIVWTSDPFLPINISGHAKISNFHNSSRSFRGEQTVSCCYISVNEVIIFQILTTFGNVHGTEKQIPHG